MEASWLIAVEPKFCQNLTSRPLPFFAPVQAPLGSRAMSGSLHANSVSLTKISSPTYNTAERFEGGRSPEVSQVLGTGMALSGFAKECYCGWWVGCEAWQL
jgi:hypothetical protein